MRIDSIRGVKEALKSKVGINQVSSFLSLDGLKCLGNRMQGKTPFGESKNKNSFVLYLDTNSYYCFNYGKGGDIFSLVEEVAGVDFMEALRMLATQFEPALLPQLEGKTEGKLSSEHVQARREEEERYAKSALYELIFEYGKLLLFEKEGQACLDYLIEERGYSRECVEKTEWMFFPEDKTIREFLLKKCPKQRSAIDDLNLQGAFGDHFRLAFPYRDRFSVITGFMKRFHVQEGHCIPRGDQGVIWARYDSNKGIRKNDLFGLNRLRGSRDDTVILVEGCADAMYLPTLGLKNVVAIGQGMLSGKHLEGLRAFGIENVILSLDHDEATGVGEKNTHKCVRLLQEEGLRPFVIDPALLGKCKDPDAFVQEKGIKAYESLVSQAESGAQWAAKKHRELFQTASSDLFKEHCLNDAVDFAISLKHPWDKEIFSKTFIEGGTLTFEELLALKIKKEQNQQQERQAREFLKQAEQFLRESKLDKLSKHLNTASLHFTSPDVREGLIPYSLAGLMSDLESSREGLRLGYKALDPYITVPKEAVTIVAGRPSHGKTTFLLNVLVNMVNNYPDQSFYFFSYEETCKQIALKLIKILGGYAHSLGALEEDLKRGALGSKNQKALEKGKVLFEQWTSSKRLCLVDRAYAVDELTGHIERVAAENPIGAVFIDYIQKIKISGKFGTRQLELQKVSEKILEVAKSSRTSLILGAQLGREKDRKEKVRLDNLRECGDIEQDANLVLGILNKGMPDVNDKEEADYEPIVDLVISVLKNRNGGYVQNVPLTFNRPKLLIEDKKQNSPTPPEPSGHLF